MPLVDLNDPATFSNAYDFGVGDGVRLGYGRLMLPLAERRANFLISGLSIVDGDSIIIAGAGYGWTAERLRVHLPASNVTAFDSSSHVHGNKDLPETASIRAAISAAGHDPDTGKGAEVLARLDDGGNRARGTVLNENGLNGASRARLRQANGNSTYTWGITEDMLPWLSDAEIEDVAGVMGNYANNFCHIVTATPVGKTIKEPTWNWKTGAEWRTFFDALGHTDHLIMPTGTYEVM